MAEINISGIIYGTNVQVGDQNAIYTTNPMSVYEKELVSIFDKYCTTDTEKEELLENLRKIETNDPVEVSNSASKILAFLNPIMTGVVSAGLYDFLHTMIVTK
jgi:hypothetical protein